MNKITLSLISILALAAPSFGAWKKQGSGTDYTTNSAPAAGDAFLLWDAGTNTTQNLYYSSLLSTMMSAPGNIGGTTPGTADFTAASVGTLDVSGAASFDSIDVRSATWLDNVRITFNPGSTVAGINVGSFAGDPSTPINGDLWYDSVANELQARINGATVALGAGGGGGSGDALVANPLSQFAATTSAQLRGVLSDESGTSVFLTANGDGSSLTGVVAATGDSATSFFSTGTLEDAIIASTLTRDGEAITGSVAAGTVVASGFNGNLATTDDTVQEIAQKLDDLTTSSGSVATDNIFDAAGDIVQGTGANTSARLPIGTAGQLLKVNAGATALEYTSSISASTIAASGAVTAGSLEFEGATADTSETALAVVDPTADRTITFPDATGTVALAQIVTKSTAASYTIGTTDSRELYGGTIYVTGAATITIPAVAAGASFTVITIGAVAVSVDPNASDLVVLDGTALADGDKVTNTSTAGDIAVFTYYDATGWYCSSNSWTDGN